MIAIRKKHPLSPISTTANYSTSIMNICFALFDSIISAHRKRVLVIANFDAYPSTWIWKRSAGAASICTASLSICTAAEILAQYDRRIVLQAYQFYWLTEI